MTRVWSAVRTSPPRWWRAAFGAYALAIFALTHWPALEISTPIMRRPDLLAHMAVFSLWTVLFFLARLIGPLTARTALWCGMLAAAYAAVDESLQALPFVRRNAAVDDYLCNLAGIALGVAACAFIASRVGRGESKPSA